jgi:hypothetical protein
MPPRPLRAIALATLLVFALLGSARCEVTIDGPTELEPREAELYTLQGLDARHLADCRLVVLPHDAEGVQAIPLLSLTSRPLVYFKAREAGRYAIVLDVNVVSDDVGKRPHQFELVVLEVQVGAGGPAENPFPPPVEPWKSKVEPLRPYKLSRSDATSLARVYESSAQAVRAGDVRSVQGLADDLAGRASRLGLQGKYDGLADAMRAVYEDLFGKQDVRLDPDKTAAALLAIAHRVWEAGR